jgi:hypothetical protein
VLGATGGGIAVLGRALIAPSTQAAAPCQVALSGKVPAAATQSAPGKRAPNAPDLGLPKDLGKALGKLFGR